jgi:hypothetical protein
MACVLATDEQLWRSVPEDAANWHNATAAPYVPLAPKAHHIMQQHSTTICAQSVRSCARGRNWQQAAQLQSMTAHVLRTPPPLHCSAPHPHSLSREPQSIPYGLTTMFTGTAPDKDGYATTHTQTPSV